MKKVNPQERAEGFKEAIAYLDIAALGAPDIEDVEAFSASAELLKRLFGDYLFRLRKGANGPPKVDELAEEDDWEVN